MRRLTVLALLVALSSTACGSSEKTDTTAPPATTKSLTEEQLRSSLLQVSDLPTGYAASPTSADTVVSDQGYCGKPSVKSELKPDLDVKTDFSKGTLGPFVFEGISTYKSEDQAKTFMNKTRDNTSCGTFQRSGNTVTLSALSFPKLGDETFAARIKSSSLTADVVIIREDNLLVAVMSAGLGTPAPLDEALVRKAVTRATSAA